MIQELELEKNLSVYTKPKDILHQLDSLVEQSLAKSILQIEELVYDQLQRFARSYDKNFIPHKIDFNIEVKDHKFKLVPGNFYTYLLSEGVQVTYEETKERKYYDTKEAEFYFNPLESYGVRVEKQTVRKLLNEGNKIQRKSRDIGTDLAASY
jgi:hypothetical protein